MEEVFSLLIICHWQLEVFIFHQHVLFFLLSASIVYLHIQSKTFVTVGKFRLLIASTKTLLEYLNGFRQIYLFQYTTIIFLLVAFCYMLYNVINLLHDLSPRF